MIVEIEGRCDLCIGTRIEFRGRTGELLVELFLGVVVEGELAGVWLGSWRGLGEGCSVHSGGFGGIRGEARVVKL